MACQSRLSSNQGRVTSASPRRPIRTMIVAIPASKAALLASQAGQDEAASPHPMNAPRVAMGNNRSTSKPRTTLVRPKAMLFKAARSKARASKRPKLRSLSSQVDSRMTSLWVLMSMASRVYRPAGEPEWPVRWA